MRWFWSMIALLAVATGGLHATRRAQEANAGESGAAGPPTSLAVRSAAEPAAPVEPSGEVEPREQPLAATPEASVTPGPTPAIAAEQSTEAGGRPPEPAAQPIEPASKLSLDALLGVVAEAAEQLPPEPEPQAQPEGETEPTTETQAAAVPSPTPPTEAQPAPVTDPMLEAAAASQEVPAPAEPGAVGPTFTVAPDGALTVEGVGVIPGAGSPSRPYVIDWQVLRSVAREYNPKQGQDRVPDWVRRLDGKHVRVEGNTLLPVVAASTDELLVMQNPWDGCCVGVPPTPYDAIEVKLAKVTRMGNSPTGFGQVEGIFKVDPYIVQGWLLGLYVIEGATFESGAGMALPEL